MSSWTVVTNFASGLEADIAVEQLRSLGVPASTRGDTVGIFGIGFQGSTSRGVDVVVPDSDLARARDILGLSDDED